MSGRKSKRSQKLASTRRSLNRKSDIDIQEKENDDGLPQSGNEECEHEKTETDTFNENLTSEAAIACTDQQICSSEFSCFSESQDCKDVLAHAELANKKRKMGSTRKNNRGFKAAEQNEKESQCRLETGDNHIQPVYCHTTKMVETEEITIQKEQPVDKEKDSEPISSVNDVLHISHDPKLKEFKASQLSDFVTVTEDADHTLSLTQQMDVKHKQKETFSDAPSTPFQEEGNLQIGRSTERQKMGSILAFEQREGEKYEDGNQEEKDVPLTDQSNLSSTKNELPEEENKEIKEESKHGPSALKLKDITGECGRIDTAPVILLDAVHKNEPIDFDDMSKAEAPVESTEQHGQSVINDEQDYECTSSNQQKMAPVITDIQNDFTDQASPQAEDHLEKPTDRDLETESPENICTVVNIQELKNPVGNETEVLKMQNKSGEVTESVLKKNEPAVERQNNGEQISLEEPLHSPPDQRLRELKTSECSEVLTVATDADHIFTSVEQREVAEDDQLSEPKDTLSHMPCTPFQEDADTQMRAVKSQTKKKKRFGSTRRLQGEHPPQKKEQWQCVEATEGTEHDMEERCSEQVTNQPTTHHIFTESQSVESRILLDILDQSMTTMKEEGELKDVTGECGRIDAAPVILLEQDYEFTFPDQKKMAPFITDIQNDSPDQASLQEASIAVEVCDSESTETGSLKQVDDSPTCATTTHEVLSDQMRQMRRDHNIAEDHVEMSASRELDTEPLESTCPKIHIKVSKSTQDKVIAESNDSEKRRKMGSTRRSLRGQLPESDKKYSTEELNEKENIKQKTIEQFTSVPGEDHVEAVPHSLIPTFLGESSLQSTGYQGTEKLDKKKRKMGLTRKHLQEVENKKPEMEKMKDIVPKDDEDIAREETKSAKNNGIVNTVSGCHDAFHGCSEVETTEPSQNYETTDQVEDSLLSEIEYELKKGSSLNTALETYDNQKSTSGISDPVSEQCESALQIQSLKIISQTYTEPASPGRKRKMGSTRKTSRNKQIEETEDKTRQTEQEVENLVENKLGKNSELEKETETPKDIVMQKISGDMKGSAEDILVPSHYLTVYKPFVISEPGNLPIPHPASEHSGMEISNEQGIKPFVKEVDVSTEDGLVSLDDIRKSALYDGSSGKRVKIDFEGWNEQVPDFGVAVYNVVMVGNCNVGKTSFIKCFQSGNFSPEYYSTIGVDTFIKTITLGNRTIKLNVWDTAGQERYHSITTQVFHKAQALLLMYDITSSQSFISVRDWISQVQERAPTDVIIMLLGNKKDCAERKVKLQEGEDLSREYNIHFMECSAATGENVSESMKALAWLLVKQRVRKEEEQTILQPKQPVKKSGCC